VTGQLGPTLEGRDRRLVVSALRLEAVQVKRDRI